MTIIIVVLFAFLILNIIHHLTIIEQLKQVKRNQLDLLDVLENNEDDLLEVCTQLNDIKRSIQNIAYTNRNQ